MTLEPCIVQGDTCLRLVGPDDFCPECGETVCDNCLDDDDHGCVEIVHPPPPTNVYPLWKQQSLPYEPTPPMAEKQKATRRDST